MSFTCFDKAGNEITLAESKQLMVDKLNFDLNTEVEVPLDGRGILVVAVGLNGNTGYIFDVVYYNDNSIVNVLNLGNAKGKYSIENNILTISQSINWSYGFVIKTSNP